MNYDNSVKVKEIVLFTNGVVLAHAENGMSHPMQEDLIDIRSYNYKDIVTKIVDDSPSIKICRWQTWIHDINEEELFLLLDMHRTYREIMEERTVTNDEES